MDRQGKWSEIWLPLIPVARRRSPVNSSSRFPVAGGLARRALADAHAGIGRE